MSAQDKKLFLEEIIPVAEECDVLMAIHPDDPPWPIFGIPRIITCEANIDRFLKLVDSHYNGLTLCMGSLGCAASNDYVAMVRKYGAMDRIHFAHLRNIRILEDGSFIAIRPSGTEPKYKIYYSIVDINKAKALNKFEEIQKELTNLIK